LEIIIAGILSAIIGALLTAWLNKRLSERYSHSIKNNNLEGDWEGTLLQDRFKFKAEHPVENDATIPIRVHLETTERHIKGYFVLKMPNQDTNNSTIRCEIEGASLRQGFLTINYRRVNEGLQQYGTMMLEISLLNNELNGHYVGYGPVMKTIIHGQVALHKAN
jgi:hypothetical protein